MSSRGIPTAPDAESDDHEILGVARGSGLNLVGAFFTQLVVFGVTALIARSLGRVDLGLYSQAFAFLALLNLLALSGFRNALTRFVAVHRVENDEGALRGTVRLGLSITIGSAVGFGAVLFAVAPWLAEQAFNDPRLTAALRFAAVTLPFNAFADAALSATQGYKTMRPFALIHLLYEPAVRIVLTAALVAGGFGLNGAMAALLVSQASAAVLAAFALRRLMGHLTAPPRYDLRRIFAFSMASWSASLATQGLIWADTILLGLYRSSADVGLYQVATRLVVLATFVMAPINTSFAPRIADLYRRGRHQTLARAYSAATSWIVRLSLPGFIVLLVFPRELLGVFGPQFQVGVTITIVLAVGKFIDAGTGPCGMMLNMADRPGLNAFNNVTALAVNIGLNLWLIPAHGIMGAAVAWGSSLAVLNVVRVVQVRVLLGMMPFDLGVMKGLAAGLVAGGTAWAVSEVVAGAAGFALGAGAMAVSYAALLVAFGITEDDQLVLRQLWRRLRPARGRPVAEPA